ncbi:GTPase Era [Prosthecochloris sp. N3]|uniref:GTPase Era n=1 Tax=Prosthecochloris ethylica TaxID=2743976 RepID=A0ABR9XUR9_9CHLB|nr:GTPase Era [Prosthecochloris ethylica]MBF0587423.1 GTPase Era [Prosthecochloris ethylica]MBF0637622.1 GTPase Era [Prosthecochloris ethylica]NUK48503.1 GTPase Era [Prosthecochloris ethylica]
MTTPQTFCCGYAAIVGPPNAGKSTLLNRLLDQKLSIVTPKSQTTRKKITGIYHNEECQVIFLDTPGIMDPAHLLHEAMLHTTRETLREADVVVALIPAVRNDELFDREFAAHLFEEWLQKEKKPVVIVLNKCDMLSKQEQKEALRAISETWKPEKALAVSALHGTRVDRLVEALKPYLPMDVPLYPEEMLSTAPERFFVSEIIREKIFLQYGKEIPYSTEVVIDEFREQHEEDPSQKDLIRCSIVVERETQKHIIIGRKGSALKKMGRAAREDMEEFLGRPVFLELFVKVRPNWRKKKGLLKSYGY